MPQRSVLDPFLFLVYVNDIWRNTDSSLDSTLTTALIKLHKKLQRVLVTLWEWAVENGTKINPGKSTALRFSRARVKYPLDYSLGDQSIPEASSCKYFGIVLRRDLNWFDHVNYTPQKAWQGLHFVMFVLKNGNWNTKRLAYTSLLVLFLNMGLRGGFHAKDRYMR